ncbi:hypothetical protein FDI40_gp478 [Agrobacterium phage Atu_ph07]|uniref:Uncharacterized protein n=1 Tax=Agrobacterium phage Atu_ph07 TaxID=2024264 RepID=A0A2L0V0C7_9CAUD|nr:hypothetical protein FDI40_gp478 [Agrobacterium phage Atu_ph07]AUZ95237.1 hypothetical protein [Agrobacterium phage Atu_ph07]
MIIEIVKKEFKFGGKKYKNHIFYDVRHVEEVKEWVKEQESDLLNLPDFNLIAFNDEAESLAFATKFS